MVAVLLSAPVEPAELKRILGDAVDRCEGRHDLPLKPSHSLLMRQTGKAVIVDLYDHPWYDTSGDDQGPTSPAYAWDECHNHLLAAPWSLKRAIQQHRQADDAPTAAASHSAYVLLRVSLQPEGATLESYQRLCEAALLVMTCSKALCLFNPRGEVLATRAFIEDRLRCYREQQLPPLELLSNTRLFEIGGDWCLVDCVGMQQLQLPDQELLFAAELLSGAVAMTYVRNLAMHFLQHRPEIRTADTAGGPNESVWEALCLAQGAIAPQRPVIRWLPENREGIPVTMDLP
jgi:hypothetical protein